MEILTPVVILLSLGALWMWRSRTSAPRPLPLARPGAEGRTVESDEPLPYSTVDIDTVRDECSRLAFGVQQIDYLILGEHATVLQRANERVQNFALEQNYLPRRPMLLPKILQAINSDESTRSALAQMILQDPSLAGGVLERANTAWYRTTPTPVESIDRALAMLGTEGLRSIVATFILQPLFRLPAGYFDRFAPITWEQGQRAGYAALVLAQRAGSGDPLVAQLLALLSALSRVVLFRLTAECYRQEPNILPRAEVFARVIQQHAAALCVVIATEWELSNTSIEALQEQARQCSPAEMSPMGRTLYFAALCGWLAVANARNKHSAEGSLSMLRAQGLSTHEAEAAWQAASSALPRADS